jgi:hypothetical protein
MNVYWSFLHSIKHAFRVSGSRIMTLISSLHRKDLATWCRKLRNEELYNFYSALIVTGSRDSSVGIATGYWLDDEGKREFESR